MSTIYILWLRQLKKYIRSRARVVAQLAQPLLFLVAFGFGFGPVFQRAGNGEVDWSVVLAVRHDMVLQR